ncbi:MAG: hypothetical protein J0I22_15585 [Stenotrophomonas nitritireducens]|nr:hypothetical protein [Stenotrophomonas nitritireducens]
MNIHFFLTDLAGAVSSPFLGGWISPMIEMDGGIDGVQVQIDVSGFLADQE